MKTGRSPNTVDIIVGRNVRRIRELSGTSQTALGEALGITFQQVQKYECGANRISAGKLLEIAKVLGCDLIDLFAGADPREGVFVLPEHSPAALKVAADFDRIESQQLRDNLARLMASLAQSETPA
ncbi:helix-turn-helix domain-containing protein [Sinorhizobium meliloti]|uniref:helix-turn-helix domain-containing protein n=1 Tax=Rhizobium meliloti TaxID=382 RepID=UPI000FD91F50|nr:helix-turn-helix transcriptional regulator [Sinorhizobium meliloti]RVH17040.1 XRE family transcriptional regulator [Sinorhizobium meliloti]